MKKKEKLDQFHYHEITDRLFLICQILGEFIDDHPVIEQHKEIKELVDVASKILVDAYQKAGQLEFEKFSKSL